MSLEKFITFARPFAHSTGSRSPLELFSLFGVSLVLLLAPEGLLQVACSNSAVSFPLLAVVYASSRMPCTSLPSSLVATSWSAIPLIMALLT